MRRRAPNRVGVTVHAERPSFEVTDLAQLYARGQLPTAPDDLADLEFGPVGDCTPPAVDPLDPVEAFCDAWGSASPAPDTPQLPKL